MESEKGKVVLGRQVQLVWEHVRQELEQATLLWCKKKHQMNGRDRMSESASSQNNALAAVPSSMY